VAIGCCEAHFRSLIDGTCHLSLPAWSLWAFGLALLNLLSVLTRPYQDTAISRSVMSSDQTSSTLRWSSVSQPPRVKPETLAAQALHQVDPSSGAIVPPIQPSTTFARDEDYRPVSEGHEYSRDDNPTYELAEALLTRLEEGADCLLFASGQAAASVLWPIFVDRPNTV